MSRVKLGVCSLFLAVTELVKWTNKIALRSVYSKHKGQMKASTHATGANNRCNIVVPWSPLWKDLASLHWPRPNFRHRRYLILLRRKRKKVSDEERAWNALGWGHFQETFALFTSNVWSRQLGKFASLKGDKFPSSSTTVNFSCHCFSKLIDQLTTCSLK